MALKVWISVFWVPVDACENRNLDVVNLHWMAAMEEPKINCTKIEQLSEEKQGKNYSVRWQEWMSRNEKESTKMGLYCCCIYVILIYWSQLGLENWSLNRTVVKWNYDWSLELTSAFLCFTYLWRSHMRSLVLKLFFQHCCNYEWSLQLLNQDYLFKLKRNESKNHNWCDYLWWKIVCDER